MNQSDLKYRPTHEWIRLEGNEAVVGISEFAVKQLTDLVYIDLPAVGRQVKGGETFGEVESVKAVSDLYAPLSGEVIAVNDALVDDLALLSSDPFGKGWMIKIKVTDDSKLGELLHPQAYEAHCEAESH
ncbi:MAG: glycine cleavage system protein GcvH [Planctomycetota bacterium]|nr:glycine cleavage system protein GcvH [Planctomycetota bacterium]MDA1213860.1 glycine cleavage system protein GcvH [Planctomycetota bacterium]